MSASWAVVVFPGSNCDRDCVHALRNVLGQQVVEVWHRESLPPGIGAVVVPGGFSYGDYLRTGALAGLSHVMRSVREHAAQGRPVIGICNGFQILTEAGMLPGVLMRNATLRFHCRDVHLRVERGDSRFTAGSFAKGDVIRLPIAHGCGRFHAPAEMAAEIEENAQVILRYSSEKGEIGDKYNINGSLNSIAGISNREGNVLGMMPHPERACEEVLGGTDGRGIFLAMAGSFAHA